MVDAFANGAVATVSVAPSPATSGGSLTVVTGQGSVFPTPPFDLTMSPPGVPPIPTTVSALANAEIARCTGVAGDVLSITRAQYGTTAQAVAVGWQVAQNVTANLLTELEFPAWFQSGSGDPVTANPTTPNTVGGLYFDTSGATGLWMAAAATNSDWLAACNADGSSAGGLRFITDGTGLASVVLSALGTGESASLNSGIGSFIEVSDTQVNFYIAPNQFNVFINNGNPNGVIAASTAGDLCVDTSTPGVWQATAADNSHWIQFGGTLPTSSAGLVTGSFYTTANVVHVA